jgi:hypothetical protein
MQAALAALTTAVKAAPMSSLHSGDQEQGMSNEYECTLQVSSNQRDKLKGMQVLLDIRSRSRKTGKQ